MSDDTEAQEDEMTALRSILVDDDGEGEGGAEDAAAVVLERVEGSGLWHGRICVAAEMVPSLAKNLLMKVLRNVAR